MQSSALIQAVIDICQLIFDHKQIPADKLINTYFKERRYIGAKDKRAIATRVYTCLRLMPRYIRTTNKNARSIILMLFKHEELLTLSEIHQIFSGETYSPPRLTESEERLLEKSITLTTSEKLCIPDQLYPFFVESMSSCTLNDLATAYLSEATFDLRVNTLKSTREVVLKQLHADGLNAQPTIHSPIGIRFDKRHSLEGHSLIKEGLIDVQDEGSQLIALSCEAKSKMTVLDYCAGAGGKTLALAAEMENKGQLFACDIHEWRLKRARERTRRADIHNIRFQKADDPKFLKRHQNFFDRVLVDAPCSGTGTWRRNPDMKIKTTANDIIELQTLQRSILAKTAPLVRPGGWLIYATCSVLKAENHDQVVYFLENYPQFELATNQKNNDKLLATFYEKLKKKMAFNCEVISNNQLGLQLLPHIHNTDGFFISIFVKNY